MEEFVRSSVYLKGVMTVQWIRREEAEEWGEDGQGIAEQLL